MILVISDRISAFDCIWHEEQGLAGVPGKGAALNAFVFWFTQFRRDWREAIFLKCHILLCGSFSVSL